MASQQVESRCPLSADWSVPLSVTIREALEDAASRFSLRGIEEPLFEAELLLAHVLGLDERWRLRLDLMTPLDPSRYVSFFSLVDRRLAGEPVAYILGTREFWSRRFHVSSDTLIPRPETELIIETAMELISTGALHSCRYILDAGTGSGILAVTLALEITGSVAIASDISFKALEVARMNILEYGLAGRIGLVNSWWLSSFRLGPAFDLVVSNPPYIGENERYSLAREVRGYEPENALFSGPDGLDAVEGLLRDIPCFLNPGGWFLCEIGFMQGRRVLDLARSAGRFRRVEIKQDLAGIDRVLAVQSKGD